MVAVPPVSPVTAVPLMALMALLATMLVVLSVIVLLVPLGAGMVPVPLRLSVMLLIGPSVVSVRLGELIAPFHRCPLAGTSSRPRRRMRWHGEPPHDPA